MKKNILISLMFMFVITLGLIITLSFTNEKSVVENFHSKYAIYPVSIPEKITFAGESVPIHNFDVRESLDRELLINTYWQSQTLLFIKKSNRYFPIIEPILKANGVPDDLKYIAVAESGLMNVTSPAGAKGFWQIMKGTAKDYHLEVNDEVDERYNLEKSTQVACDYLKKSYEKYGSWAMAAASYNMGRKNISKQIARQKTHNYYDLVLGSETGRYVFRALALKLILEEPEKYGFYVKPSEKYQPIKYKIVTVDTAVADFADFAYQMGVNYKVLKQLNPWLRDNFLTNKNHKTYNIKIAKIGQRQVEQDTVFYPKQ